MSKPTRIHYARSRRELELSFDDGQRYVLTAEFLRVHSPSAEVRGHGPGQEQLQTGKSQVAIEQLRPQGHYALQLVFDDGHDSGIYTWDYLRHLGEQQSNLWRSYLDQLEASGASRDPDIQVVQFIP